MLAPTNDRHPKVVRGVLQYHRLLPAARRLRTRLMAELLSVFARLPPSPDLLRGNEERRLAMGDSTPLASDTSPPDQEAL